MEEIFEENDFRAKDQSVVDKEKLMTNKIICFYFAAHWCPPCRSFTPQLIDFYNHINASKTNALEIVFVSDDQDQAAFDSHYLDMPWHYIRFDDPFIK